MRHTAARFLACVTLYGITAALATGGDAHATAVVSSPELPAFDYAFRFASAIAKDPKDRAKAQELAIEEFASAGALDEAVKRADVMEGWRRGAVYADLATALAGKGRTEEARTLVARAEEIRATVSGWENPRISAHVAQALAVLGEGDRARAIVRDLAEADPTQYAGRAAATEASVLVAGGDFEEAMTHLGALADQKDLDTAWWRTVGYLDLADRPAVARKDRLRALEAARAAVEPLPVSRKVEGLERIATAATAMDRRRDARRALADAAAAVDTLAPDNAERIPLLTALGSAWGAAGEAERARAALASVETLIGGALEIDRPGLLARVAAAYRGIPDAAQARRLDDRAFAAAEGLRLSRPRALAVSAICREMGRSGAPLDQETRARLDALLAGLGEPW